MNDSAQRSQRSKTPYDGRLEKRLRISRPVYLARPEEPRARERTLTENVSAHGARVVSTQFWQPGQESLITPHGDFPQLGRVIYCLQEKDDAFSLGIQFLSRAVKWDDQSKVVA